QHERPALAIRLPGSRRRRRRARLLRDGVPRPAGIALALPAAKHGAAVLADEAGGVAGHGGMVAKRDLAAESTTLADVPTSSHACRQVGRRPTSSRPRYRDAFGTGGRSPKSCHPIRSISIASVSISNPYRGERPSLNQSGLNTAHASS